MIELQDINSYYGKAHILNNLSFKINKGEVVSLLGRNGAGKTTTMKSIMQLVRPKTGTVKFDGQNISNKAPHQIAKRGLGYVPEERRIFTDLTILENLEVGRQPARDGYPQWTQSSCLNSFQTSVNDVTIAANTFQAANSKC